MADEGKGGEEGATGAAAAPKTRDPQLLLVLANTLLIVAALGVLVYTKLLFERPPIVEDSEMQKKQEELKTPPPVTERPIITFDQVTVNIAMTSGKAHYVTIAYAVEARDPGIAETVKAKKALFVDKVLGALGRRQMSELNTIQGKLLLKTELMREFNKITVPGGVTDMYFSTFILQ